MILREKQQQSPILLRMAFTLMEMLVVVAIIVALAGLGGFYVMGALEDAKKDQCKAQCRTLKNAIQQYMIKNKGQPPGSLDAMKTGTPPILEKDAQTKDPWDQPYQFVIDPQTDQVDVFSQGSPKGGGRIPPAN